MDCPNCGVYNPEERQICWRCDKELPKPKESKRRGASLGIMRRPWVLVGIALLLWFLLTWLLPLLLQGIATPSP